MSINHYIDPNIEPKLDLYAKSITAENIGISNDIYEVFPQTTQLLVGDETYYLTGGQRIATYKFQPKKFGEEDIISLKAEGYFFTTSIPNGTPTKVRIFTAMLQRENGNNIPGIEEDSKILYSHLHMQCAQPIDTGDPSRPYQSCFLKASLAKKPVPFNPISRFVEFDISPLQINDFAAPYNSYIHYSVELVYTLPPLP